MAQTINHEKLLALLEKSIKLRGRASAWAKDHGFSQPFISLVRSGAKQPGERLSRVLGYKPKVTKTISIVYEKLEGNEDE